MKIIAIANQKGGVGKTTTTLNLAVGLQQHGKKVLCIDFDPQCHLGKYIGHTYDEKPTIADCLFAKAQYYPEIPVEGIIRHSAIGVDYIPASLKLAKADLVLAQAMFRERVLADVLELLPLQDYDYVLIDCNPSMGILLTNVLIAADGVIVPVQAEEFAVDGLADMLDLIRPSLEDAKVIQTSEEALEQGNPRLQLLGLLPTMLTRTTTSDGVVALLHREYPDYVYQNGIRRSIDASKSTGTHTPLVGSRSKLGQQYERFAKEFLERMESNE